MTDNNFENKNPYNYSSNPYNLYHQMDYYKRLEQENLALKEQMRQTQFVDPIKVEFEQSQEYQEAKKNNVLTFLFANVFTEWKNSELGKQFAEWEKKEFENYKNKRAAKTSPPPPKVYNSSPINSDEK